MGFKPHKEYRPVPKKSTASYSGNKKKGEEPIIDVSNSNPFDVLNSVDNDVEFGEDDSEDEVASVDNDMARSLAYERGFGTQSLLEQWRDSYGNGDYDDDPYDDDMYEVHDLSCFREGKDAPVTTKLQNDIMMFQQHQGESLSEAWAHYKDLLQKVPHHGIDLWLQVQIFYDHVSPTTRRTINQSAGVQRLMEAHLAPKSSIQVNKITSSCEICSGPHDTQYYMENPEQAFVDYTSLRNNEVGVLSNFDAHKEKRLSSIGTQLRQQQDDMINKIDTLWRVVSEKFDNMPANDTAGNSMACVNAKENEPKEEEIMEPRVTKDDDRNIMVKKEKEDEKRREASNEKIEEETEEKEKDDPEYFDIPPTIEELSYHEWLLKNPWPSWVNAKIKTGNLDNIKISCMAGQFLKRQVYIDPEHDDDQEKTHYSNSLNLGPAYRRDESMTEAIRCLIKMKNMVIFDKKKPGSS
ncbi:hypothetical protein Tco_1235587 [Tanacetum coccineum]